MAFKSDKQRKAFFAKQGNTRSNPNPKMIKEEEWKDLTKGEQLHRISKQMKIGIYDPYLKRRGKNGI